MSIKLAIWDLDGTLYRYKETTKSEALRAAIAAARMNGISESAEVLEEQVNAKHIDVFKFWADQYGLAHADLHHAFHDAVDIEPFLEVIPELPSAFAKAADIKHVILTHGSHPWAVRVLNYVGARNTFPDDHIFSLERSGFKRKDHSAESVQEVLDYFGVYAAEAALVEDSVQNLRHAHYLGTHGLYLAHAAPLVELPPYVRAQETSIPAALSRLQHWAQAKPL